MQQPHTSTLQATAFLKGISELARMADITPDFNTCLKGKGVQPILKREYDLEKIDSFLQEAYSIVKPTVLFSAGLTDRQ